MSNEGRLFGIYIDELIAWNKKFNLTAVTDPADIRIRHFEDSLSVLEAVELKDQSVVDVGPGAGFPGLPLKLVRPKIKLTLIEATRKKVEFLKHVIQVLNLSGVEVIWGRAEEIQKDKRYAGQFNIALARAVAKLPELIKYCLPFLKKDGLMIAQKQTEVQKEINASKKIMKKFGGELVEIKPVRVGPLTRSLVVIKRSNAHRSPLLAR